MSRKICKSCIYSNVLNLRNGYENLSLKIEIVHILQDSRKLRYVKLENKLHNIKYNCQLFQNTQYHKEIEFLSQTQIFLILDGFF